jgi:hypothetical protein
MEGYKEVAIDSVKYVHLDGQVFNPGIIHKRGKIEYKFRKFIGQELPVHLMHAVAKLPFKGAKDIKKNAD